MALFSVFKLNINGVQYSILFLQFFSQRYDFEIYLCKQHNSHLLILTTVKSCVIGICHNLCLFCYG